MFTLKDITYRIKNNNNNIIKENDNKSKPKYIIYFPIILNNVNLVLKTLQRVK